jgi:hypothetical protein
MNKEKNTRAKAVPVESILAARRRQPFYDAMEFPLGKGKIVVQAEAKDVSGRKRAPRHTRLLFRNAFGERILAGPFDIRVLADWLGVDLAKQISRKPGEFAEIYSCCTSGSRALVMDNRWLKSYRTSSPALADAKAAYVENNRLHYFLWVGDADLKGFAIYRAELDIRTFLLNSREVWHRRDEDSIEPDK